MCQLPEKIALIFPVVSPAEKPVPVRRCVIFDPGVMPGRDLVAAKRNGHAVKRGKLEPRVAGNAGYRCLARKIALDKGLDDIAVKVLLKVQNIERKAELIGHPPCVVNIVKRAAAARERVAVLINIHVPPLVPQLHRKANEVMPLLL